MYVPDNAGLRQRQQVVVAFQVATVPGEPVAAVIGLLQAAGLDYGAHGPVQQQDAFLQQAA